MGFRLIADSQSAGIALRVGDRLGAVPSWHNRRKQRKERTADGLFPASEGIEDAIGASLLCSRLVSCHDELQFDLATPTRRRALGIPPRQLSQRPLG